MNISNLLQDKDYLALPEQSKAKVAETLLGKDRDFMSLPEESKIKVLNRFVGGTRQEPAKVVPLPEKARTFTEELGQAVAPHYKQIAEDVSKIGSELNSKKSKILTGDQLREQFKKDWGDAGHEVAAFINAPIAALGGALAAVTAGGNVEEGKKRMQKVSDMLTFFHPNSEALKTAFSLVGSGINVAGADIGVVSAEAKRLLNRDITHEEYQQIVDNAKYLTNVTAMAYPTIKATAARTAPIIKSSLETAKNKLQGADKVSTPEEHIPEVKVKEEPKKSEAPKKEEVQPKGQLELPFSTSIEDVYKRRLEANKIQGDLFSEKNIRQEETFRTKKQQEDLAWKQYKAEKDQVQKQYFEEDKRLAQLEKYEREISVPKERPDTFHKQQGPRTRAAKAQIDYLYTANPLEGIRKGLALLFGKSEAALKGEDLFYTLAQNRRDSIADETMINLLSKQFKEQGLTKERTEKFADYYESGNVEMSPEDHEVYNKVFIPLLHEYKDAVGRVDVLEGKSTVLDDRVFPRYALEKGGVIDRILGISREGIPETLRGGIKGKPTSRRERTFFALEYPDKSRQVVSLKDGILYSWEEGQATPIGRGDFNSLAKNKGKQLEGGSLENAKITEATQAEVSKHTDTKYLKDSVETLLRKTQELKSYERSLKTFDTIKNSPEFSKVAMKEEDVPAGMEGKLVPFKYAAYYPQLRGYVFDPKIAATLEDFLKPGPTGITPKLWEMAQNYMLKAMFLYPLAHMNNEAMHWIPERGFAWINPEAYKRLSTTGKQAANSVLHQDELQVELLRNGAPLLYPSIRNQNVHNARVKAALEEASKDPKFIALAKELGMPVPNLLAAISKGSNTAMWASRDMMFTQLVLEHMEKAKPGAMKLSREERAPIMKQAIQEVGKHMPTYEIPSYVLKSRHLAKFMKNPVLTVFSYYHYGVVRSFAEFGKSLIVDPALGKGDPKKLAKDAFTAIGQMAAIGFIWSMYYPWMDKATSVVLGEDVKVRRAGGFKLIQDVINVAKGDEDISALIQSLLTPAPMLQTPAELFWNKYLPFGKDIRTKEDPLGRQAKDLARYGYTRLQPGRIMGDVYEDKKTAGQAAKEYFFDVKVQDKDKILKQQIMRAKNYLKVLQNRIRKGAQLSEDEWQQYQFLVQRIGSTD